jgi:hypothetical protein
MPRSSVRLVANTSRSRLLIAHLTGAFVLIQDSDDAEHLGCMFSELVAAW